MQQRRLRPGDVLDDYCPRERRITDHAIVAMIEDHIKQTRCVVCDAEHEYKEAKIPPQRRKKAQAALFTQVLDGLQGPQPAVRLTHQHEDDDVEPSIASVPVPVPPVAAVSVEDSSVEPDVFARAEPVIVEVTPVAATEDEESAAPPRRDEGFFRRSLIRATLPRTEGQQPPARTIPDFTIRQPGTGRGSNRPGRRRAGAQQQPGPMRFGRSNGNGSGNGQRSHGRGGHGNGQGPNSHGRNGHGQNGGRRRGGKKR